MHSKTDHTKLTDKLDREVQRLVASMIQAHPLLWSFTARVHFCVP